MVVTENLNYPAKATIYNMSGKKILSNIEILSEQFEMELNQNVKGILILVINDGHRMKTKRIMVE